MRQAAQQYAAFGLPFLKIQFQLRKPNAAGGHIHAGQGIGMYELCPKLRPGRFIRKKKVVQAVGYALRINARVQRCAGVRIQIQNKNAFSHAR